MFKEMSREMSDAEVRRCLSILIEEAVLLGIERDYVLNEINVTFRVLGDDRKDQYSLALLPDSVQDVPEGVSLRINGEYMYIQYLVAKGYSQYWQGNMFVDE